MQKLPHYFELVERQQRLFEPTAEFQLVQLRLHPIEDATFQVFAEHLESFDVERQQPVTQQRRHVLFEWKIVAQRQEQQ